MRLPEPRTTLLLDGLGALATAVTLCIVLPHFASAIGLSPRALVMLGLLGGLCACYSLGSWKFVRNRWRRALAIIMTANTAYCVVSAIVVGTHWNGMTVLGVTYFVGEILVILALVGLEAAVLRRCSTG